MLIDPRDEMLLTWYCCQTDFERSTLGTMLAMLENYADGVRRHLDERNLWIRTKRAEWRAAQSGKPWAPESEAGPTPAYPRRETRAPAGNLPSDEAYERKAAVESVFISMERAGHHRATGVIGLMYGPTGGYFDDQRLPRHWALAEYTEPGMKLLDKAYKLLRLTAVGADIERHRKSKAPSEELGERGLRHYAQMAIHLKRCEERPYAHLREIVAAALVEAEAESGHSLRAWAVARAELCPWCRWKPANGRPIACARHREDERRERAARAAVAGK